MRTNLNVNVMQQQENLVAMSLKNHKDISTFTIADSGIDVWVEGVQVACPILLLVYVSDTTRICCGEFWGEKVWEVNDDMIKRDIQVVVDERSAENISILLTINDRCKSFSQENPPNEKSSNEFMMLYFAAEGMARCYTLGTSPKYTCYSNILRKMDKSPELMYLAAIGVISEIFRDIDILGKSQE